MTGSRGPVPKRDADRRRRNKPDADTTKVEMPGEVEAPDVDPTWHEVARDWYVSLAKSGQSRYFEPSDWAAARFVAHDMSNYLKAPRISAQMFAAIWSAMSELLTTEGARRRVRMEVERNRGGQPQPSADGKVVPLDRYRDL